MGGCGRDDIKCGVLLERRMSEQATTNDLKTVVTELAACVKKIEKRVDSIEKRLNALETRVDQMGNILTDAIAGMEARLMAKIDETAAHKK